MNYLINNIQNFYYRQSAGKPVSVCRLPAQEDRQQAAMEQFLSENNAGPDDFAVLLTACGQNPVPACASCIEGSRTFYPDLRYALNLPEGRIESETALKFISAASHYLLLHRTIVLYAAAKTPEETLTACLADVFRRLDAAAAAENPVRPKMEVPDDLACDMHLSETMRLQLQQLLQYCRAAGFDAAVKIREYYADGRLPCHSKREGKKILDEFCRKFV